MGAAVQKWGKLKEGKSSFRFLDDSHNSVLTFSNSNLGNQQGGLL